MPLGDGTGPTGQGPGTGRGKGGRGIGGAGGQGQGRGRMGGTRPGAGPGGECICPGCGARGPHTVGIPCYQTKCPKCGTAMARS